MNVCVTLAYKGTNYVGFQVQPNGRSVCATFQDGLQALLGTRPDVKGCSRTDAGVHALGFCLNFQYDGHIPPEKLPVALNAHLPADIRVLEARPVADDFHARYAAHSKTYCYRIRNSAVDSPFDAELCHRITPPLDVAAMAKAAALFCGRHDFTALCASGSSAAAHGDTVRTITACTVEKDGPMVCITVTADGYLYNMVRILAGTLTEVGLHKRAADSIPALLQSGDRRQAGPTLPAKGLFLQAVHYEDAEQSLPMPTEPEPTPKT